MINDIQKNAKERMGKSILSLEEEFGRLRTGRASPSILEPVIVSYYGTDTPLVQLATIVVEGPLMLAIKPWEKRVVPEIEKAIRSADLGLNPSTSGDVIRVPFPPLSEERRKDLFKKVKGEGENAKVAIRNIRRDANQELQKLHKDKAISEDELRKAEETMQKLTDSYIHEVDALLVKKEKDLMEM